jgi:tetratricopeptide (TPR) repeat protein
MVSTTTGEWERSLAEWRNGFTDADAVGDTEAAAEGMMGVGYCQLHLGRLEEARVAAADAIRRSTGATDFILSLSLCVEGMRLFSGGDLEDGMKLVRSACEVSQRIADYEIGGVAHSFLAQMTFAKGDAPRALALYDEALAMLQTVGDIPEIARVHSEIGWTALAGGDPRAALAAFRRAVHAHEQVGSPRGTGLALLGIAAVEAAAGRPERAVAIAAAAHALSERAGIVIDHAMVPGVVERIEALKASIPKGTLSGLVAKASGMTPAEVLAMVGERDAATAASSS